MGRGVNFFQNGPQRPQSLQESIRGVTYQSISVEILRLKCTFAHKLCESALYYKSVEKRQNKPSYLIVVPKCIFIVVRTCIFTGEHTNVKVMAKKCSMYGLSKCIRVEMFHLKCTFTHKCALCESVEKRQNKPRLLIAVSKCIFIVVFRCGTNMHFH